MRWYSQTEVLVRRNCKLLQDAAVSKRCNETFTEFNRGQTCKEKRLPYSAEVVPAEERCGSSNGEPGCGVGLLQKERGYCMRLLYDLRPQEDNINSQGGRCGFAQTERRAEAGKKAKAERKTARIAQW